MSIGFDAASSSSGLTNSLSFSHTVGSGDRRILIVGVGHDSATEIVTGVTYGGVAMTLLIGRSPLSGINSRLFYLLDPAAGAANVVVSLTNTVQVIAGATSWTGVNQDDPFLDSNSAEGSSQALSVDVLAESGGVAVDCANVDRGASQVLTVGAGQTERWNRLQGLTGIVCGGSSEPAATPPGETTTMSWTAAVTDDWSICAAALRPFDSGSGD